MQLIKYRADVDGLRAVAVLAVVFFHAGFPFVSGGYVGVDVFFVISGYLITLIIAGEIAEGRFSLAQFYARRVRRIFPALFVVLAVTWCVSWYVLRPSEFQEYSESVIAAALSVANVYYWKTLDYFAGPAESKPLLHTWSLGVEEQYYVFYPLLLMALFRWCSRYVLWGIVLCGFGSFSVSALLTERAGSAAFYLLPFRGWELMIGAALAVTPQERLPQQPWVREVWASIGLLMILWAVFTFSEDTVFPGTAAALPALGTAFLIAARGARVNALLSWKPLVFLGLISYSLYLWHWPVIVYANYYALRAPTLWDSTTMILISTLLAYVSWRWVEEPFRRKTLAGTKKVLTYAVSLVAVTTLVAFGGVFTHGFPGRYPEHVRAYAEQYQRENFYPLYDRGGCFLDTISGQTAEDYDVSNCATFSSESSNKVRTLIYGDSYAAHLYSGLKENPALAVRQYTATSCRPMITANDNCMQVRRRFLTEILPGTQAEVIIVSANWINEYLRLGEHEFSARVEQSVLEIQKMNKKLLLVGQSPKFIARIPDMVMIHHLHQESDLMLGIIGMHGVNDRLRKLAERHRVRFFDPIAYACDGSMCQAVRNAQPLHWDVGHMTAEGSRFYAKPLAEAIFSLSP